MRNPIGAYWSGFGAGVAKFIEIAAGAGLGFKALYALVAALAGLAILIANTAWSLKLTALGALIVGACFSAWRSHRQESIHSIRINNEGFVTLKNHRRQEIPGVLEKGSWTTRWITIVPVGRFDRWRPQRLLVCASRNSASDYRQLLRFLRFHSGIQDEK